MKFIISLLLMALLSFAFCLYLPWWSTAIACFLVSVFIKQKRWLAFVTGFLSVFLLWGGLSLWLSVMNDHILAHKVSMIILKKDSPTSLILITGLIGAITGSLSAWSGSFVRPAEK
jgi:hypothetical protein